MTIVDKAGAVRTCWRISDGTAVSERRAWHIPPEGLVLNLEPTVNLAIDADGSQTWYRCVLSTDTTLERYDLVVPDSQEEQSFFDLAMLSAIDPGSLLFSQLLPDYADGEVPAVLVLQAGEGGNTPSWLPTSLDMFVVGWDDMSREATAIPTQGQQGDPDRDTDGSLLFSGSSIEQIACLYQMRHVWVGTPIRPHMHWAKTTAASGDVVWEERHRIWNNGEVPPDWSAWTAATLRSLPIDDTLRTLVDAWDQLDMTGKRVSCMVSVQYRRNPTAVGDTYTADARLYDADIHYQRLGGSLQEYPT